LKVSRRAAADLQRRARYLAAIRGSDFANCYVERLLDRLRKIAVEGAQFGTARGPDPALRTFGYEGQATVLAYFAEGELEIVRVYFTGQDWTRGSRGRRGRPRPPPP
jgi:plasmid stabilization system protein ParE